MPPADTPSASRRGTPAAPRRGAPAAFPADSVWTAEDRWGAVRCRLGRHRAPYSVLPGIYALNRPDALSPILVTANYKLTFDLLRRALGSVPCWILVLDTHGKSVGCGMASGAFSIAELAKEILDRRLSLLVDHRRVVAPPLAREALASAELTRHTGFEVRFGPWRPADLLQFLRSGCPDLPVQPAPLGLAQRALLVPGEVWQSLPLLAGYALVAFVFAGLTPAGLRLDRAWDGLWPLVALGAGATAAGSVLAPLLPASLLLAPAPPARTAAAGWALGAAATAVLLHAARLSAGMDPFLLAACYAFLPAAAAGLALRFRRAAPERDRAARIPRLARALGIAAATVTLAGLVLSKLRGWGMM